jgi:hypothetical protein
MVEVSGLVRSVDIRKKNVSLVSCKVMFLCCRKLAGRDLGGACAWSLKLISELFNKR